jgi:hypothetical protein
MAIKLKPDLLKKYPRNLMNFLPWLELYDDLIRERKYIKWLEDKHEERRKERIVQRAIINGELINAKTS